MKFSTIPTGYGSSIGHYQPGLGAYYNPRLVLLPIGDQFSIGVKAYPAVGLAAKGVASNGGSFNGSISYIVDLPVLAEISFGARSTHDNEHEFGLFLGIGFGYTHIKNTLSLDVPSGSYGPVFDGGARLKTIPINVRLSFMPALNTTYAGHILTFTASYDFRFTQK